MMLSHQKYWIEVNLAAPGPGMTIFSILSPKKAQGGEKIAKIPKKKLPLDIPIVMLNRQKIWIEVNVGAPGPGMIIFSIFQPQKYP